MLYLTFSTVYEKIKFFISLEAQLEDFKNYFIRSAVQAFLYVLKLEKLKKFTCQ
jgi:hypothetical protein